MPEPFRLTITGPLGTATITAREPGDDGDGQWVVTPPLGGECSGIDSMEWAVRTAVEFVADMYGVLDWRLEKARERGETF